MQESHKRSCTYEEVIDTAEAAKILGMTERSIRNHVEKGILKRVGGGHKILVSLQDVLSAAGRLARNYDFVTIASSAIKALVMAARAERRLDRIETLLGIDGYRLGVEEEDVLQLVKECRDVLTDYTADMKPTDVLDWAYRMYAVTEEYLHLVKLYASEPEPWVPFMEAAQKMADSAPVSSFPLRRDLEIAYAMLNAARRHLRQVAFFYIYNEHGRTTALSTFPELQVGERDESIINILLSTRVGKD